LASLLNVLIKLQTPIGGQSSDFVGLALLTPVRARIKGSVGWTFLLYTTDSVINLKF